MLSDMISGLKYNTTEPVVEARYEGELNPDMKAKIAELGKTDPKAAQNFTARLLSCGPWQRAGLL